MARTDTLEHFLTDVADAIRTKNEIINGLPDEYQGVEYIEADGTQYIDTGWYPAIQTDFVIEHVSWLNGGNIGDNCVLGGRKAGGIGNGFKMPNCYNGHYEIQSLDTVNRWITVNYNTKMKFRFESKSGDNKTYINDIIYNTSDYVGTCDSGGNLYLFALNQTTDDIAQWFFHGRLYYCKIWENNTLIRTFVPCYRKADSVVGLYDLVNDVFYTNSGTGTFTYGPNIEIVASNFDTKISNITYTQEKYKPSFIKFYNNRTVTDYDYEILNLDTSDITDFSYMFYQNDYLERLDLSHFNTSNATSMERMFYLCNRLSKLDISSFDTSNVTNMGNMFADCSSLQTIDIRHFNMNNVTNAAVMFSGCSSLTTLLLPTTTLPTRDFGSFMKGCSSLTSLDMSGISTTDNRYRFSTTFGGCTSLMFLNISSFTLEKTNLSTNMFGTDSIGWVPANCEIIVKDAASKTWMNNNFARFTNVKTLAEYEAEQNVE